MAPHLLLVLHIILFFTGLSGTQSVSTVSHVSVTQGDSITIPCLYDQRYRNNVKYWCRGYHWSGCSTVVRTDHPKTSGNTSISDDINQQTFTVTITRLSPSDSDYYWCIVEKYWADDGVRLQLSVTPGTPGLYVDQQEVTGVVGGRVTVSCYSSKLGVSGRWCRMGGSGSCVAVGISGTLNETFVMAKQEIMNSSSFVFMVNTSELRMENTGWYWCEKGDLQMPVHITVNQPTTITTTNQNIGGTDEKQQERIQSLLVVLLISLSLLVVVIAAILVTWTLLRKHKDQKAKGQPPNTSVQPADPEQDITYSTVRCSRGTAQRDPFPDDAVTYSTVVTKNKSQPNAAEPDDVVYSTVAPHQR